jgi:hypothetical protein
MKKDDFFRLFWAAWVQTFTEKLVLSAFKHTGLIPFNPNVILDKFATKEAEPLKHLSLFEECTMGRIDVLLTGICRLV